MTSRTLLSHEYKTRTLHDTSSTLERRVALIRNLDNVATYMINKSRTNNKMLRNGLERFREMCQSLGHVKVWDVAGSNIEHTLKL